MPGLSVAHVCLTLGVGGLERIILGLTRSARERGNRVHIYCLEHRGSLAEVAEAHGATVLTVGKRPGLRPAVASRLVRQFRTDCPDVVHTHQIGALLYAGPAAFRSGVPAVVHTEHGNHFPPQLQGWSRVKARGLWSAAAFWADQFVCVSSDIAKAAIAQGGVPGRKVIVLPNGTETDPEVSAAEVDGLRRQLGLPVGVPVIGTVGRLAEVKQQDLLIRALARLRKSRGDVRLLLVGDGPERERLESLARETGLADAVVFAGQRFRPEPFYRLMTVFARSSRAEGMPVAVLEAWASGLPVVCTAVGGLPELVTHQQTGWLVPPGDTNAFAEAIGEVLDDRPLASRVGAAGREFVRLRFGRDQIALQYENLYDCLLARRRTSCAS